RRPRARICGREGSPGQARPGAAGRQATSAPVCTAPPARYGRGMESPPASRRAVLGAGASLLAASQAQARPRRGAPDPDVMRILERYDSFGDKASGGPGDTACGEWLEGELKA